MTHAPVRTWWSATEIAEAALPDLPRTARGVNDLAKREGWANQPGKARRRKGRGGGLEFHVALLPLRARLALTAAPKGAPAPQEARPREAVWAAFEALKASAQGKSRARLAALEAVERIEAAGLTRSEAVAQVAALEGVSEKTIWNWLALVDGVAPEDRAAYLAPRSGGPKGKSKPVDARFLTYFKSDYLRDKAITFQVAYEHALEFASREGIDAVPPLHLCRRRFNAEVPAPVVVLCREGAYALKRFYPHQERSRSAMRALECVQADFHKLDLMAHWPGEDKPVRPQIVVFSDIYSGKILAWRMALNPNAETVRLCFGDVVSRYGIPQHALFDNGREFAAKVLTGGAATRYRFKDNGDDMLGLFPLLGIEMHWASPGWGQAKPVEKAFLDLTRRIPTHPSLHGSQTGNDPRNKPKDYGSKPAELGTVLAVVGKVIEAHNARADRRTETAWKQSFDEVFNESYKAAPIKQPTEAQKRLWLMAAEPARAKKGNGELRLYGNRYWSDWMYRIAGERVVARYDPDRLWEPLHVYSLEGQYFGAATIVDRGGFLSKPAADDHQRKRNQWIRVTKDAARLHKELDNREIAALLGTPEAPVWPDDLPQAEVVQLATPHARAPKAPRAEAEAGTERQSASVARLDDRRARPVDTEDPDAWFARALELEARVAEGHPLTPAQSDFLSEYQQSAEYRSRQKLRAMFDD